jgi:N-acetyl-gamma-glutamyl-phosphate reductase
MTPERITVGVVGASGYTGGEACRLLLNHDHVARILPFSRGKEEFETVHPNLLGCGLSFVSAEEVLERRDLDAVLFCTPTGEAMRAAKGLLARGVRIVDLSADFRFRDPQIFERTYGKTHASPHLLTRAVYGVTEIYREAIRSAELVANPGCYVITALLGLLPALKSGLADLSAPIVVSAVNGTSGASATAPEVSHPAATGNMLPYSLSGHRHGPELEDQLGRLCGRPVHVLLNTTHGPFARGIQATISLRVKAAAGQLLSRRAFLDIYREHYGKGLDGEHFVVLNDRPSTGGLNAKEYSLFPGVARVCGSNFCHIGLDYDASKERLNIVAVTDNLVKGAAGSAIQNMNVMFGFPETAGLRHFGI